VDWATARADAVLREIERFLSDEVAAYRQELAAAGIELLGGGGG
jgi:hypothetical protein